MLEPIGFGFAGSLGRYLQVRERYPDAEMMMGIGNLTELTDVDSAGVNVVLLGFCQELGIRSVLTTQVINWARSSVRECDLARRLVYHSVRNRVLPKHLEPRLVMLRDPDVNGAVGGRADAPGAGYQGPQLSRVRRRRRSAPGEPWLHLHDTDPFLLFDVCGSPARTAGCPGIWMPPMRFISVTKCAKQPRHSRWESSISRTRRSIGAF